MFIFSYVHILTQTKRQESPRSGSHHIELDQIIVQHTSKPICYYWISWESILPSWWDNKVWNPFWYSFLCQTLPERTHTTNYIVRFWIGEGCWFWGPFGKSPFSGKWLDFSLKDVRGLGINFGSAKFKLIILGKATCTPQLFSVLCESRQTEGMHIDSCNNISVEEYLCHDCWDPASKSNNL